MARGDEVKLLGSLLSPYVHRARIALNLKGVGYEFLQETSGSKSELLLKSNPVYKKIPVLLHNGKPVCESMIIVQYIDEVWGASGPALLPADPYDCAVARFWAVYIDDKWSRGFRGIVLAQTKEAKVEAAEQHAAGLLLLEEAFEKCSKGKNFFGGDTIGYLDIALGSFLVSIKAVGKVTGIDYLDQGTTPLLARWAEHFCSHAAVKEVLPETDKMIEYVNAKVLQAASAPPAK